MTLELRRQDYSLDARQEAWANAVRECSAPHQLAAPVPLGGRAAAGAELWRDLTVLAPPAGGLDLVDLAIAAREIGRSGTLTPLLETVVAWRVRARLAGEPLCLPSLLPAGADGPDSGVAGTALVIDPVLLPAAAMAIGAPATRVLALVDGDLCEDAIGVAAIAPPRFRGLGALRGYRASTDRIVLAGGERAREAHRHAVREWRILASAHLAGMTDWLVRETVAQVSAKRTMGVPLGTLQAVSFPLADAHIAASTAAALAFRAAWLTTHEPGHRDDLADIVWLHARTLALRDMERCTHLQGVHGYDETSVAATLLLAGREYALAGGDVDVAAADVGRQQVGRWRAGAMAHETPRSA